MSKRYYIKERDFPAPTLERDVIFDTNVWLSIYGLRAVNQNAQTRVYSAYYKELLECKRSIYLVGTVASEYIHRSMKMREEAQPHATIAQKIHQQRDYAKWMDDIADEVSYLRDDCIRLNDGFDQSDPEVMCRRCIGKPLDYNDMIIADFCKSKGLFLVTDDADFSCEHIDIVTMNGKLVAPSTQ